MDVSEETASLHRERLTSLSYIATRLLVLGIVFHIIFIYECTQPHKFKADVCSIKEGGFYLFTHNSSAYVGGQSNSSCYSVSLTGRLCFFGIRSDKAQQMANASESTLHTITQKHMYTHNHSNISRLDGLNHSHQSSEF